MTKCHPCLFPHRPLWRSPVHSGIIKIQIKNQLHVLSTPQNCMKTTACLFIKSIFKLFAVQFSPPKLLVVSLASVGISLDPAASVSSIDSLAGPFSPAFLDLVVSRCQITPFSFLTSSFFAVFA